MNYRGVDVNTGRGWANVLVTKKHDPANERWWDTYNLRSKKRAMEFIDAGLAAGMEVVGVRLTVTDEFTSTQNLPETARERRRNRKWK